jgi:N-acyl-D-aspartate/D-glutamate deacylase
MSFKVSQGVTTVVAGNCGISIAPLAADTPLPSPLDLLDASERGRYEDFAAYFEQLERTPAAVNVASLVGHTTLRVRTMSSIDRPAEADEIMAMQRLLDEALAAGALGLSTGTFYPPAAKATTEEIIEVGRALGPGGAIYVTHMRDEADRVMEALDETFRIGRELDVPVVVLPPQGAERRQLRPLAGHLAAHPRGDGLPVRRARLLSVPRRLDDDPHRPRHARRPRADRIEPTASGARRPRPRRDRARMGRRQGRGGAPPAARQRDLLPDGRGRRPAHPCVRRHDDRLGRHRRRAEAASAPLGHVSARARALQPRRRAVFRSRPRSGR